MRALQQNTEIYDYDNKISFVYFNVTFNTLALILFLFFFLYAFNERERIYKHHDTISSFCAEKNSWGSRFLLSFTCIVGVNMLCLHVEEYNSRPEESDVWFWFTIGCIFPLPLVGICYTKGKDYDERDDICEAITIEQDPRAHRKSTELSELSKQTSGDLYIVVRGNEDVDCGLFSFPISYSERIHDLSAGVFFGGLTVSNLVYCTKQILEKPEPGESMAFNTFLFALSVLNGMVLIAFFIINKVVMRYQYGRYLWKGRLRVSSFVLECLSGFLVIFIATVVSMKRNKNVTWI